MYAIYFQCTESIDASNPNAVWQLTTAILDGPCTSFWLHEDYGSKRRSEKLNIREEHTGHWD